MGFQKYSQPLCPTFVLSAFLAQHACRASARLRCAKSNDFFKGHAHCLSKRCAEKNGQHHTALTPRTISIAKYIEKYALFMQRFETSAARSFCKTVLMFSRSAAATLAQQTCCRRVHTHIQNLRKQKQDFKILPLSLPRGAAHPSRRAHAS